MTRVIIETQNDFVLAAISNAVNAEIMLLQRSLARVREKIRHFETKYGHNADRSALYGHIDDMELLEWEGEIETADKLQNKLFSLEDIQIEERR